MGVPGRNQGGPIRWACPYQPASYTWGLVILPPLKGRVFFHSSYHHVSVSVFISGHLLPRGFLKAFFFCSWVGWFNHQLLPIIRGHHSLSLRRAKTAPKRPVFNTTPACVLPCPFGCFVVFLVALRIPRTLQWFRVNEPV